MAHINRAEELAPIIAKIKANDSQKEELLLAVHNYIYKHMLSIAINQMDHDKVWAEDVYIETFNYLMQDRVINMLKNNDKFEGWFAISLMNRCRNAWKKKGKIQKHETFESSLKDDEVNFFENIPAGALADPSVKFEQKEIIDGLHALMSELPKMQEACINMTWFNGNTCKVTAAALDIPEGTVKTNVSKAKKYIEHRIVELRKENKSFYAIAPVPFLIWMMQKELEHMQTSQLTIKACELLPTTQQGVIETESTVADTPINSSTRLKAFFATTKGKIVAGIVAASIVGAAGVGIYSIYETYEQESSEEIVEEQTADNPTDKDASNKQKKKKEEKKKDGLNPKKVQDNTVTDNNVPSVVNEDVEVEVDGGTEEVYEDQTVEFDYVDEDSGNTVTINEGTQQNDAMNDFLNVGDSTN